MNRSTLLLLVGLVLSGCESGPEPSPSGPDGSAVADTLRWTPLADPGDVFSTPLERLAGYVGVTPAAVPVGGQLGTEALLQAAYPTLASDTRERWRGEGWITSAAIGDEQLAGGFFPALDTTGSTWHTQHRVRLGVDDPRAEAVEFVFDLQRPKIEFVAQLRAVLLVPSFREGVSVVEQARELGLDAQAAQLLALHPKLGAVYGQQDAPGRVLVTSDGRERRVSGVFQGPLPAGFSPWADVRAAVIARREAGRPLGPLAPWLRHAAFGELDVLLGEAPVTAADYEAVQQSLLSTLHDAVSPGQLLSVVRFAQELDQGLSLNKEPLEPLLPAALPKLIKQAKAQQVRAADGGLPIVAATWGWLAWELGSRQGARSFTEALRAATLPVFFGDVRYAPAAVAGTPLELRGGAKLASASVKRDERLARWKVASGDFDSLQGLPTVEQEATVSWQEANPAYDTWFTEAEDLQDQLDFNIQSTPTIEVPTGRIVQGVAEIEKLPDTTSTEYLRAEELAMQLDAHALDEPEELIDQTRTIPVAVQRYQGTVTRRYIVSDAEDRVIDRFDEVTDVSLELRKHEAVPEAGVAALDEHLTLDEVSAQQRRGVIGDDLGRFYRTVLQRALRGELERRLPEGVNPADAADELAWGQWWLGLEVDADLAPALGEAAALQAGNQPLLALTAPREDGKLPR